VPYNLLGYFIMLTLPRAVSLKVTVLVTGTLLTLMNIYELMVLDLGFNISVLAMISFIKQMMLAANY
jgi:hypothetical protein